MGFCRQEDDYIAEKIRWVITLSNGETIYQDDDRPGEKEPKTWLRLKEYVNKKNLDITSFKIQFCSHIEEAAPPYADGYYFTQKVDAVAFGGMFNRTYNYYIVGHLLNDKIHTTHWMIPEIIKTGHDIREPEKNDPRFILNYNGKKQK